MNGAGYIPPGLQGGNPYVNTAGPQPIYSAPAQQPVYSGTNPAPYATDQPALIPEQPASFDWFDYYEPSQSVDYGAYDWSPPDTGGYDPAAAAMENQSINYGVTMPGSTIGLQNMPVSYLDPSSSVYAPAAPSGPLESIWDVITGVGDFIWDAGKFILENLDVGISYAGDIGNVVTQKKYYEALGDAQKTAAEAALIKAQAYAAAVAAGTMTQGEANARMAADKSPIFLTTPQAQVGGPNYLLYGAIGLAAYLLLKR